MSKIFDISNNRVSNGWHTSNLMGVNPFHGNGEKRLFLFMIGGTGASIIEPLLYYFDSFIYKAGYSIIPVFIDRHFHSEIVSRSLTSIKNYQIHCAFTASHMITHNPYLFIDDNSLLTNGNSNLQMIFDKIAPGDTIAFAYSVCSTSKKNVKVKQKIMEKLFISDVRIFNFVFLPYFNFQFGDSEFLKPNEEDSSGDYLDIDDYTKHNLICNSSVRTNEHFFYVGLPKPSRYTKSEYQQNPFNVVSLIQSYALSSFLPKELENKGFYEYGINIKPTYTFDDIIPNSQLRQTVIKYDFKTICWKIILQSGAIQSEVNSETQEQITMYFEDASRLIRQLQDKTIHRDLNIVLRKHYDFEHIWKEFVRSDFGIVRRKHSESSFICELLSYINRNFMNTPNMIIHEVLQSVDLFINEHWAEIDQLYF